MNQIEERTHPPQVRLDQLHDQFTHPGNPPQVDREAQYNESPPRH